MPRNLHALMQLQGWLGRSAKPRENETTSPPAVIAQAASAIHTMARDMKSNGGNSAASDSFKLASAYIPNGNTRLHSVGV